MNLIEMMAMLKETRGITMYQIAMDLGISTGTVYRWKNGGRCYMATKRDLEEQYNIELSISVLVAK